MAEEGEGAAAEAVEKDVPTAQAGELEQAAEDLDGEGVAESKEESAAEKAIDVSKPVQRPDKAEYEAKTNSLNEEVAEIKDKIDELDTKIAEAKSSGSDQSSELKEAKEALKALREKREQKQKERAEIVSQQEAAKASLKSKVAATKSLRAELKYETPEKYDERILELEKKQSTTSMTLREEKNLLKEIEQLKSSKKLVTALAATNTEIQADKQSTQSIGDALKAKTTELDEIRKQYDKQKKVVDALNEANSSRRAVLPALFKEKDTLRKEKQAKIDAIRGLRAEFRQKDIEFREYKKELVRLRNEARKKEEEARQAEIEARRRKAEEEELKRIPYEEEMELCDYLANFLTNAYMSPSNSSAGAAASSANDENVSSNNKNNTPPLEFEGMVLAGKAAKDEEDYLSLNSQFGKKKGRGKKKGGLKVTERISLVPETIEIFGVLNLEPPATLSAVADSIKQLEKKKEWFKQQPRGAIPSIRDKQRAEEAKAQQRSRDNYDNRRGGREGATSRANATADGAAKDEKKTGKKKERDSGFNAAEAADEAFPSLPGATKPLKAPVEETKDELPVANADDDEPAEPADEVEAEEAALGAEPADEEDTPDEEDNKAADDDA